MFTQYTENYVSGSFCAEKCCGIYFWLLLNWKPFQNFNVKEKTQSFHDFHFY